jgi:hypothetical protein
LTSWRFEKPHHFPINIKADPSACRQIVDVTSAKVVRLEDLIFTIEDVFQDLLTCLIKGSLDFLVVAGKHYLALSRAFATLDRPS